MKAICVRNTGDPDVLQLEELPDPTPGPQEVLVRINAAGVNPVDTYIRSGNYTAMPSLPYVPGADAAGLVEAIGDRVKGFATGDRVYTAGSTAGKLTGGYAELVVCHASQVHPLPERVSFAEGAAVGVPYATAYRGLFDKANARPGETVLIHGASGAVGLAAVQLAAAHGMTIIGTAGSDRGRELVGENGAHHVLDHTTPNYLDTLRDLTDGRGADVILEMLANVNLARDLDVVARFGRVIVIGNRGPIEINARATMTMDSAILGLTLLNCTDDELGSIHAAIVAGLGNGALRPVVGQEYPLAEAARAHVAVLEAGAYGKIVLKP